MQYLVDHETVAVEPLSLTKAKSHLQVGFSDDDTQIEDFVKAARENLEQVTSTFWAERTGVKLVLDSFPAGAGSIVANAYPITAVDSIRYRLKSGAWITMAVPDYYLALLRKPVEIFPTVAWPTVELWPVEAVEVTCTIGLAPSKIPARVNQCLKLHIGHMYENREAVAGATQGSTDAKEVPMGYQALVDNLKRWRFK